MNLNHRRTFGRGNGISRRMFLQYSGVAGATMAGYSHAWAAARGIPDSPINFGIMFPNLRSKPFAEPSDSVRVALLEVGKRDGIMDANEDLRAGPKRLLLDPTLNGSPTAWDSFGKNPFNPTQPQGTTFFGQFIDHDITFDQSSILGAPVNPLMSRNQRTPALDLDSVFGGGPSGSPELYLSAKDGTPEARMKLGSGGAYPILPFVANGDGTFKTLMADPRQNETILLEGLVLAYMAAYNRVIDDREHLDLGSFPTVQQFKSPSNANELHQVAREVVRWHYHWLIINEYLPQIVGRELVDDILANGNRYYRPPVGNAFLPIEFGSAAFRFGHSQVDASYRANFASGTGESTNPDKDPFWALLFDPSIQKFDEATSFDRDDLLGGFPAKRRYVGWQTYFDFGDGQVMFNKRIKPVISSVVFTLPVPAIAPKTESSPTSLPQRNLLRQLTWALPSGQTLAQELKVPSLSAGDLKDIGNIYAPFATERPLWYYVLAEAKTMNQGLSLGPVGGRIVAETLIGLVRADANSYLNKAPKFKPFLGKELKIANRNAQITGSREYTSANLLHYAGVVKPGLYR